MASGAAGASAAPPELAPVALGQTIDRFPYIPAILKNQVAKVAVVAVTDDDIRKKNEADHLRRVFDRINTDGDGLLQETEVAAYLTKIGYTPTLGEVQKLIWEIDDDADGAVSWKEFQATHLRLVNYDFGSGKVAYEPRGFFNLIEFSVMDKDGDGTVDATEVITVFYRRYGKQGALKKLDSLVEQQALDSTITFTEFLAHDNKMRASARADVESRNRKGKEPPKRNGVVTRPI